MITEKLYDIDSQISEFKAKVVKCEAVENGYAVILDRTAFFPEGGGQASDRGYIANALVFDVQIDNNEIVHYTDKPLEVGTEVNAALDWERRMDYMQQHSGEHIVSGVAHSLYGAENVGFHLGDEIVTLDFDIELTREQIETIEKAANEAVFQNVAFNAFYPDEATLKTMQYRSKKEFDEAVRIVEIDGIDRCACCAPHVKTAAQIGIIKLLDSERLRGGVRIELKCGRRALADYNIKYDNVRKIGALLSAAQNETAAAVEGLSQRLNAEKLVTRELKHRLADAIIASASDEFVIIADGLDVKELQLIADGLHKKNGKTYLVMSQGANGTAFALCGNEEDANAKFAILRSNFTVRGGGRNGLMQGSITEKGEDIKFFFKNT